MTSEPSAALADQYGTGRALLAAVTSRAKLDGVDPQRAQREFTQERFLARVFAEADGRWVLKGGTAMIARVRDARTTGDVDLLRREGSMEFVLDELRELCALDDDHMPDFGALQAAISDEKTEGLIYFAFDLLFDGCLGVIAEWLDAEGRIDDEQVKATIRAAVQKLAG